MAAKPDKSLFWLGKYLSLALTLPASLAAGYLLGTFADNYFHHPLLRVAGILLGFTRRLYPDSERTLKRREAQVIGESGEGSIRRIYILTSVFAVAGFAALWPLKGFRTGLAYLLGALVSLANLYLFGYLSRAISPATGESKPWEARAYISRYVLLFAGGYAIVKALGVSPLAVIVGMLASTAAVVSSIVIELFERLLNKLTTR